MTRNPLTAYRTKGISLDRMKEVVEVVKNITYVSNLAGFVDRIAVTHYDATGNNPEVVWYRVDWIPGEEPRVVGEVEVDES